MAGAYVQDVRYVAVPWMAESDACPWMYGMSQGARDGSAVISMNRDTC